MNIFMILCDELRADTLGFMGNETIKTPCLDEFSKDAIVFENAYCNTPMCVPSRNSISTGRYAHSHGALDNMLSPLDGEISFMSLLQEKGYKTTNHGKWHCNISPLEYGYDEHYNAGKDLIAPEKYVTCFGITHKETRKTTEHKRNQGEIPLIISGKRPVHMDDTLDSVVTDRFINDLKVTGEQSVFARLSIMDPHTPYIPSEPFASMYDPFTIEMPTSIKENLDNKPILHSYFRQVRGFETLNEMDFRKSKASYYGLVSHVDQRVGKVVTELKDRNLYDDSLIIFIADHGSMMGEHGFIEKWGYMYDEVMKVPLMIKLPENKFGGKRLESFVESVDIMPTILELLDMDIPEQVQGKSLVPYITGDSDSHKNQVFGQYYCGSIQNESALMVRDETWKLTSYPEGNELEGYIPNDHPLKYSELFDKEYPHGELYNIKEDPKELNNLFDVPEYKTVKNEYMSKIKEWMDNQGNIVDASTMSKEKTVSLHVIKQGENMKKIQKVIEGEKSWSKLERINKKNSGN